MSRVFGQRFEGTIHRMFGREQRSEGIQGNQLVRRHCREGPESWTQHSLCSLGLKKKTTDVTCRRRDDAFWQDFKSCLSYRLEVQFRIVVAFILSFTETLGASSA
jgi:hypothetical protein